jgi:hypothetical protein
MGPNGLGIGVQYIEWGALWALAVPNSTPKLKANQGGPYILPDDWWCYPPNPAYDCILAGAIQITVGPVELVSFNLTAGAVNYTSLSFSWDLVPNSTRGVTFYQIFKGGDLLTTVSASTGSYTDNAVVSGTPYNYQIRAIKTGSTGFSNPITMTSLVDAGCNTVTPSGGEGIQDTSIGLSQGGGFITIAMNPNQEPDKIEIIHNGVKKATSGMTGTNAGPFDNSWGTEPSNNIPQTSQSRNVPQFIGSESNVHSGNTPSREAEYRAETGSTIPWPGGLYTQLIWWKYTTADFNINNTVKIRVTGPAGGTKWDFKRLC